MPGTGRQLSFQCLARPRWAGAVARGVEERNGPCEGGGMSWLEKNGENDPRMDFKFPNSFSNS
jgi:hypothetical protein